MERYTEAMKVRMRTIGYSRIMPHEEMKIEKAKTMVSWGGDSYNELIKISQQKETLRQAGCYKVFEDRGVSVNRNLQRLASALLHAQEGFMLVIWRLDRLSSSMARLNRTIRTLAERGIEFRSLDDAIDTTLPGGHLIFRTFGALEDFQNLTKANNGRATQKGQVPERINTDGLNHDYGSDDTLVSDEIIKEWERELRFFRRRCSVPKRVNPYDKPK